MMSFQGLVASRGVQMTVSETLCGILVYGLSSADDLKRACHTRCTDVQPSPQPTNTDGA